MTSILDSPHPDGDDEHQLRAPTDPGAIIALCLAVAGLSTCGITSVIGAAVGHRARSRIRRDPTLGGENVALASVIIGATIGALAILWIALGIVVAVVDAHGMLHPA